MIFKSAAARGHSFFSTFLLPSFLLFTFILPATPASKKANDDESSRIVAVGDIHGNLDSFQAILRRAGIIDAAGKWKGGETTLVQTGDFLDRGPQAIETAEFLMSLGREAAKKGGRVEVLLGNHEVMNLLGDLRYVAPDEYRKFAGKNSEKQRQKAYQKYVQYRFDRARKLEKPEPVVMEEEREEWFKAHPPGFLERLKQFQRGKLASWLRELPATVQIGQTVFLHGGIHPNLASVSLQDLNKRVRRELEIFETYRTHLAQKGTILPFFTLQEMEAAVYEELQFLKSRQQQSEAASENPAPESDSLEVLKAFLDSVNWMIRHPDGPFWFRGYAEWTVEESVEPLKKLLTAYHAERFVVGHTTVVENGIQARFGGQIILIDTGMLSSYYQGGAASALEIVGDNLFAVYLNRRESLPQPVTAGSIN